MSRIFSKIELSRLVKEDLYESPDKFKEAIKEGEIRYSGGVTISPVKENILLSMGKILQEVYPDNWDFSYERYSASEGEYKTPAKISGFIINFGNLEIKNSKGKKHLIKNLFVKLKVDFSRTGEGIFIYVEGLRTLLNDKERSSGYIHSHLPSRGSMQSWSKFCTGSGEINDYIGLLGSKYTEENFQIFLVWVLRLVTWESLEGAPHIKISSIRSGGRNVVTGSTLFTNVIRKLFRDYVHSKKLNFTYCHQDKEYKVLRDDNFDKLLKFIVSNILEVCNEGSLQRSTSGILCYKDGDNYIVPTEQELEDFKNNRVGVKVEENSEQKEGKITLLNSDGFLFRGEMQYFYTEQSKKSNSSNKELIIFPPSIDKTFSRLEYKLNKKLLIKKYEQVKT